MANSSIDEVINKIDELLKDADPIDIPLDKESVAKVAKNALEATGVASTIEETEQNPALMNEVKLKLLQIKAQATEFISDTKELAESVKDNIDGMITQATEKTLEAGGYAGATNQFTSPLVTQLSANSVKDAKGLANSAKNAVNTINSNLKTLASNASGILTAAASISFPLPGAFMASLNTLATLKTTVAKLKKVAEKL